MAAAQHTPTPWATKDSDPSTIIVLDPIVSHFYIGTTFAFAGNESPTGHENAAFIVRACNAHDDLLAALKALRTRFHKACVELGTTPEYVAFTTPDADAAIAKAEGL